MDTNEQVLFSDTEKVIREQVELYRQNMKIISELNARISYLEDRLDFYMGLKESNIDINMLPLFGVDKKKIRLQGATLG